MLEDTAKKVNIFRDLSQPQLHELTQWLTRVSFKKGHTLFREGQPSDGMYLLCDGIVTVEKETSEGPVQLAELGAPSFFGEASQMISLRRTATVKAKTDVNAGHLPKTLLRAKLNDHNLTAFRVTVNLARLLAERVAETNKRIAQSTAKNG